jgi:predicted kinase
MPRDNPAGKGVGKVRQLPQHHIRRDRMTALLADGPVALVDAGGDYSKSVLAAEYAASLGIATALAALGSQAVSDAR